MKQTRILSGLDALRHRANLWALSATLGLGVQVALAQSFLTVKVETNNRAMVSDVKVKANLLDKHGKVIETLDVPKTDAGKYTTETLRKGSYNFLACDEGMRYEPQLSGEVQLGENDNKKVTLVLGDQRRQVAISGLATGAKVCLIHKATGCEATREIDNEGNILIRGTEDHYDIDPRGPCR